MATPRGVYQRMTIAHLNQIRSLKTLQLTRIANLTGYFANQDTLRLAEQISAIDAELACRKAQEKLF